MELEPTTAAGTTTSKVIAAWRVNNHMNKEEEGEKEQGLKRSFHEPFHRLECNITWRGTDVALLSLPVRSRQQYVIEGVAPVS